MSTGEDINSPVRNERQAFYARLSFALGASQEQEP